MSLRSKMTLQIGAMLVGLLLVSASALFGLNALHQDYGLALAKYLELREVYGEVGSHLRLAETALPDRQSAAEQIDLALRRYDLFVPQGGLPNDDAEDRQAEAAMRQSLADAYTQLQTPPETQTDEEVQTADGRAVLEAIGRLGSLGATIHHTIQSRQQAAIVRRRETMLTVGVLCTFVMLGAILLGVLQYRSVLLPLTRLRAGVRNIAAGQFTQRLDDRGSEEFASLASEFNRMAAQLDEFYHRLEQKVAEKSRELIRSERLASVGFLAAGVAHEINNPLGIIAGYAEYSLSELKRPNAGAPDELAKSLQVICDEAFRCKDIIGKLLSLARPGEAQRQELDLAAVAQDVIAAVGGLRDYRDRSLNVSANAADDLRVLASEAEMKQVILNLAMNALEAVAPGGQVRIEVARHDEWVELRVKDNGRGMTPQTLERVFEPFFTEKRGARQPGTGLGLSITHAIVESHGGRLIAHSEGLGKGSEFVVQLPAAHPTIEPAAIQRSVA